MKTIGAKELRLNLNKVLDDVLSGKDIIVKHRFKDPVTIQRVYKKTSPNAQKSSVLPGLQALKQAKKLRPSPFDPNKSIKELYAESIAKKYGL